MACCRASLVRRGGATKVAEAGTDARPAQAKSEQPHTQSPVPFLPDQVLQVWVLAHTIIGILTCIQVEYSCLWWSLWGCTYWPSFLQDLSNQHRWDLIAVTSCSCCPCSAQDLQEAAEGATGQVLVGADHLKLVLAALRQQQAHIAMVRQHMPCSSLLPRSLQTLAATFAFSSITPRTAKPRSSREGNAAGKGGAMLPSVQYLLTACRQRARPHRSSPPGRRAGAGVGAAGVGVAEWPSSPQAGRGLHSRKSSTRRMKHLLGAAAAARPGRREARLGRRCLHPRAALLCHEVCSWSKFALVLMQHCHNNLRGARGELPV